MVDHFHLNLSFGTVMDYALKYIKKIDYISLMFKFLNLQVRKSIQFLINFFMKHIHHLLLNLL